MVSMVELDSSEVSGSDSEPLPDPEPPVVSLLSRLKVPTTSDKEANKLDVTKPLKNYVQKHYLMIKGFLE